MARASGAGSVGRLNHDTLKEFTPDTPGSVVGEVYQAVVLSGFERLLQPDPNNPLARRECMPHRASLTTPEGVKLFRYSGRRPADVKITATGLNTDGDARFGKLVLCQEANSTRQGLVQPTALSVDFFEGRGRETAHLRTTITKSAGFIGSLSLRDGEPVPLNDRTDFRAIDAALEGALGPMGLALQAFGTATEFPLRPVAVEIEGADPALRASHAAWNPDRYERVGAATWLMGRLGIAGQSR